MKVYKYVTVVVAFFAMAATFVSCDREVDVKVDAKEWYWIDFTLSNAGSLSSTAQDRFTELRDTVIYGGRRINVIEHGMYATESYVKTNFNAVAALPDSVCDIVQKIMIPTSQVDNPNVRDFEVSMVLSKDSMKTVLATKVWKASEVIK